jgi:hypothetical protein
MAFLPGLLSLIKEKQQKSMLQIAIEQFADAPTGYAAETAALVLSPRSKAATGIMANATNNRTNDS